MFVKLLFLFFSTKYIKINCAATEEKLDYVITPGIVDTYQITYNNTKHTHYFGLGNNNKTENDLIIHFYSIDCNININPNNNGIISRQLPNSKDRIKNMYSYVVKKNSTSKSIFKINIKNTFLKY